MTKRVPPATPATTHRAPVLPPKTRTLPESLQEPAYDGPDVVTMLRVFGTATEFELPRDTKTFTLGSSPDRDVMLPDGFLSALHCVLERRHGVLRVHDQGSYNGTFFGGRRETTFDVRPGDTFTAGSIRFLALNDEMRTAYPILVDILGSEDEEGFHRARDRDPGPSEVIVTATHGGNLLITGEPGCEQDQLARTVHAISLLRGRALVELDALPNDRTAQRAVLDRASRATLVLSIDAASAPFDPAFTSMMFSSSFQIRVIAIASTIAKASEVLGDADVRRMQHLEVRPLAWRTGAIPRLLDRMFAERGAPLRTAMLHPSNQAALQAYRWPGNVADLRVAADRLIAIARDGAIAKAARTLGVSTSTLHYWFTQLGLSQPLVTGEAL